MTYYRLITDLVIILHFIWILFLMFGFYFALKRSRIAYIHVAGLLFSLVLNLMGWYCPLTHLENHFDSLWHPGAVVTKSFIGRTIEKAIYPDLDEALIRKGEIFFVALNGAAYAWMVLKKTGISRQKSGVSRL